MKAKAQNLKEIRTNRNLTQREMAKAMKVDPSVVSKHEQEQNFRKLRIETICKYAKALGSKRLTVEFKFNKGNKKKVSIKL